MISSYRDCSAALHERHSVELRHEVAGHLGPAAGLAGARNCPTPACGCRGAASPARARTAAPCSAAPPVRRCPGPDPAPGPLLGEVEQALLLATHRGAARPGGHEQRLDAERVPGAEHFTLDGVPQREREHAPEAIQRVGAPVVVGRDDGLAVAVGVKYRTVFGTQLLAQFEVVVDLAVEHQHVAVRCVGGSPAQRLMAVRDVDDRQPVEAEDHGAVVSVAGRVGPGAGLVGTPVTHQVGRVRHRVGQPRSSVGGDVTPGGFGVGLGRGSYQGEQSAHRASMSDPAGPRDHRPGRCAGRSGPRRDAIPESLRSRGPAWSTLRSIRKTTTGRGREIPI